jgi:SAM-dependent methyltransferase
MTAYSLRTFDSPERELERLRAQVRVGLATEAPVYERHGLLAVSDVIDVGAGSGEPARWMRSHGVHVTCVDLDPAILSHAPSDSPRVVARGDALPFASATFGGAFSRFLLQHVPDAAAVVRELARVVRPGGRVVVMDTDLRTFLAHPRVPSSELARERWLAHARAREADPFVGVRLRSLVIGAGCADVRTDVLTISSDTIGREAFADVALSPHARVLFRGEEALLATAERELSEWVDRPDAFGVVSLFVASGRVE